MKYFLSFLSFLYFLFPSFLIGADSVYRVKMLWLPQAEFAGFYVAVHDGLYEKAGVPVQLQHPKPQEEIFDSLQNDETDIIVSWPISALERAASGDDIVNIGQLAQKSSLMLIARKDSEIKKPSDISGHRVGLWIASSLQAPFLTFFEKYQISVSKILPVLTNADLFLYRGVDVIAGVRYDDYYRIYSSGINEDELVCFYLGDTFPELVDDGLYCKRSTYEKNPQACQQIRNATLEGWRRAFADKKRTLEILEKECQKNGLLFNIAHQRWMLNCMEEIIFPNGKSHSGILRREAFISLKIMTNIHNDSLTYEKFVPVAAPLQK